MQPATVLDEIDTAEDAVVRLLMAMGRRFRARSEGDSVDPSQAAVLYSLACRGAMRLGDLAESLRLDASTVSRHVHQLDDQGLVHRIPDPADRRASIVDVTEPGRAALRLTFDQRRSVLTDALAQWSAADRDRLRHDIVRLLAALEESS